MPLPTELYEKAAAGHYTLDEVLRMERVAELESLDPSQLLDRLAQVVTEKAAAAPCPAAPGRPKPARAPLDQGKKKEAMNPNFSLATFKAQQAAKKAPAVMSGFGLGKGTADMTPGWDTHAEAMRKARVAGGTALKDLLTKYRATKTGSAPRGWLDRPAGRVLVRAAGGGLVGGAIGAHTGYMAGGDREQVGRATRRGAGVGALMAGLHAVNPEVFPMGKAAASEPWDAARIKDVALHAAIHGGVGLGLGGAGVLAHRALSGIADRVTSGRDRRRILEVHPSIARENTPEQIDLAFNSLRRFSPHVTKDPLAGGNALGTILRSRDPLDPSSAPRISGATVAADLGSKVLPPKSEAESAITSAMMAGAQGAMGAAHQRTMETAVKQPHAERMEIRRDVLQRDRDADIQASRRNAAQVNILRDYLVNQLGHHPDAVESILTGPKP